MIIFTEQIKKKKLELLTELWGYYNCNHCSDSECNIYKKFSGLSNQNHFNLGKGLKGRTMVELTNKKNQHEHWRMSYTPEIQILGMYIVT